MARYVTGCIKCQNGKPVRHSRQTKLVPISTEECPFEKIAIDLVVELLQSEDFNPILVIRDQFTKVQDYVPAKTTWILEDVTDSYIDNIWKYMVYQYI